MAAILVILSHSKAFIGDTELDLLAKLTLGTYSFSHLGVATFFIISGYLITQSSQNSTNWKSYIWKRFLRLIPGLIVVLLLCAFVLGPIVTTKSLSDYFRNKETYQFLFSTFLYVQNYSLPGVFTNNPVPTVNGSLWTLAYEFTLYIAVLFCFLTSFFKNRHLLLILWIVFFLFRAYLGEKYFWYSYASPYTLNLNMMYLFEWSFYFLSGMLVFLFRDFKIVKFRFLLLLISLHVLFILLGQRELLYLSNYIFVPYLVFFLSFIPGKLNAIGKYGDYSYGIYIYAFPIQQLLVQILGTNVSLSLFIIISIVTTFPFAFLSWHLIEKQALKLKKLF